MSFQFFPSLSSQFFARVGDRLEVAIAIAKEMTGGWVCECDRPSSF